MWGECPVTTERPKLGGAREGPAKRMEHYKYAAGASGVSINSFVHSLLAGKLVFREFSNHRMHFLSSGAVHLLSWASFRS